jgi:hypothetical protein
MRRRAEEVRQTLLFAGTVAASRDVKVNLAFENDAMNGLIRTVRDAQFEDDVR